jgi:hypothetical protein
VQVTVGRHAAGDGVEVDPIVAAALSRRPGAPAGPPRHGHDDGPPAPSAAGDDGGLGWPGDPADGSGLGWPAGLQAEQADARDQPAVAEAAGSAPVRRRSGWRRLFGGAGEGSTTAA